MKKIYMRPQSTSIIMQCKMMLTASRLNSDDDEQYVKPDNEEYNDGFTVKEYTWTHSSEEW